MFHVLASTVAHASHHASVVSLQELHLFAQLFASELRQHLLARAPSACISASNKRISQSFWKLPKSSMPLVSDMLL